MTRPAGPPRAAPQTTSRHPGRHTFRPAANPPKRLVERAGDHNDFLDAGCEVFRDGFAAWVADLPAAALPSRAPAP